MTRVTVVLELRLVNEADLAYYLNVLERAVQNGRNYHDDNMQVLKVTPNVE